MFSREYDSNNRQFCLTFQISAPKNKKIRVWAEQLGKKNSKYAEREIIVEGKRTIYFSFPYTPKKLFIGALNADDPKDKDFEVMMLETPLKTYNIWMDADTSKFVDFAAQFSQMCGYESAAPQGRLFRDKTKQFKIKFFDVIKDYTTNKVIGTPARIGHATGIIEIAKNRYDSYTIPMRMMILLHEFAHKWRNPKTGLQISDETGADINALYIYLGLGFSKIDAICVYANVFLKAQTPSNIKRMRKINDYINKFENQNFALRNS